MTRGIDVSTLEIPSDSEGAEDTVGEVLGNLRRLDTLHHSPRSPVRPPAGGQQRQAPQQTRVGGGGGGGGGWGAVMSSLPPPTLTQQQQQQQQSPRAPLPPVPTARAPPVPTSHPSDSGSLGDTAAASGWIDRRAKRSGAAPAKQGGKRARTDSPPQTDAAAAPSAKRRKGGDGGTATLPAAAAAGGVGGHKPPPPPIPTAPAKKKGKKDAPAGAAKPLAGLTMVFSGYVNPERAKLRKAALNCGAKIANDWSNKATHLVCAFVNTPKWSEVRKKKHAYIVTGDWVLACEANKRRLPEEGYKLATPDATEDEDASSSSGSSESSSSSSSSVWGSSSEESVFTDSSDVSMVSSSESADAKKKKKKAKTKAKAAVAKKKSASKKKAEPKKPKPAQKKPAGKKAAPKAGGKAAKGKPQVLDESDTPTETESESEECEGGGCAAPTLSPPPLATPTPPVHVAGTSVPGSGGAIFHSLTRAKGGARPGTQALPQVPSQKLPVGALAPVSREPTDDASCRLSLEEAGRVRAVSGDAFSFEPRGNGNSAPAAASGGAGEMLSFESGAGEVIPATPPLRMGEGAGDVAVAATPPLPESPVRVAAAVDGVVAAHLDQAATVLTSIGSAVSGGEGGGDPSDVLAGATFVDDHSPRVLAGAAYAAGGADGEHTPVMPATPPMPAVGEPAAAMAVAAHVAPATLFLGGGGEATPPLPPAPEPRRVGGNMAILADGDSDDAGDVGIAIPPLPPTGRIDAATLDLNFAPVDPTLRVACADADADAAAMAFGAGGSTVLTAQDTFPPFQPLAAAAAETPLQAAMGAPTLLVSGSNTNHGIAAGVRGADDIATLDLMAAGNAPTLNLAAGAAAVNGAGGVPKTLVLPETLVLPQQGTVNMGAGGGGGGAGGLPPTLVLPETRVEPTLLMGAATPSRATAQGQVQGLLPPTLIMPESTPAGAGAMPAPTLVMPSMLHSPPGAGGGRVGGVPKTQVFPETQVLLDERDAAAALAPTVLFGGEGAARDDMATLDLMAGGGNAPTLRLGGAVVGAGGSANVNANPNNGAGGLPETQILPDTIDLAAMQGAPTLLLGVGDNNGVEADTRAAMAAETLLIGGANDTAGGAGTAAGAVPPTLHLGTLPLNGGHAAVGTAAAQQMLADTLQLDDDGGDGDGDGDDVAMAMATQLIADDAAMEVATPPLGPEEVPETLGLGAITTGMGAVPLETMPLYPVAATPAAAAAYTVVTAGAPAGGPYGGSASSSGGTGASVGIVLPTPHGMSMSGSFLPPGLSLPTLPAPLRGGVIAFASSLLPADRRRARKLVLANGGKVATPDNPAPATHTLVASPRDPQASGDSLNVPLSWLEACVEQGYIMPPPGEYVRG